MTSGMARLAYTGVWLARVAPERGIPTTASFPHFWEITHAKGKRVGPWPFRLFRKSFKRPERARLANSRTSALCSRYGPALDRLKNLIDRFDPFVSLGRNALNGTVSFSCWSWERRLIRFV